MQLESQSVVVTAGDMYAAAASALQNGRAALAASIEAIGDHIAAGRPLSGWVWECAEPGCTAVGLAATPQRGAQMYAAHYDDTHRA